MRVWNRGAVTALAGGLLLGACGSDDGEGVDVGPHAVEGACDEVVSDADCDTSLPAVVYVHGTAASGENIAHIAQMFGSNGYCQDRFVAIDYNSIDFASFLGGGGGGDTGPNEAVMTQIDDLVDEMIEKTGIDEVFLMGHSQGTRHCIDYISEPDRAAKVAKYINYSGGGEIPNDVPTLSISSDNDLGGASHPSGTTMNFDFVDEDHYTLAANTPAFVETWKFLFDEAPKRTELACGDEMITAEGVAIAFGDNARRTDGVLEIHELGAEPWKRGEPVARLEANDQGRLGPVELERNVAYEFRNPGLGAMYMGPMIRSNRLFRGLAPSDNALISSVTTDQIPSSDEQAAIVFRRLSGAFRKDLGDSLKVDGVEVLTDEIAGRDSVSAVIFVYDHDSDGEDDHGFPWDFQFPFVFATDIFIDASEPRWVEIDWNGEVTYVPNTPTQDGLMSVILR